MKSSFYWVFDRGQWDEVEISIPESDDLADVGYSNGTPGSSVIVWEAHEQNNLTRQYPFVVEISANGFTYEFIFLRDLPSLIELLPKVAPWRAAIDAETYLSTLDQYLHKQFRATHGHHLSGCCSECDPTGYERRQEARKRRKQNQSEGKR